MTRKIITMIGCLLIPILINACSSTAQTVEVTRIVPQKVVATQLVTQIITVIITSTPLPTNTPVFATATPQPTDIPESTPVIDMSLQDPAVVVTQYYTLLGLHLFEQAYQLLDSREQHNGTLESFISGAEPSYKVVKVLQVLPYNDWIKQNHINKGPVKNASVYHVRVYVIGENMTEMTPQNGLEDILVYTLVENGQVKIEFNGDYAYYYDYPH